ncbi:hypothetical protein AN189_10535 [Loktanella sp. 3ANDIMAR09]|uniref:hypothetical protein n=1 Tax=Loktanella sp. 3ANDIMAR09 TaxID=1225657 RepID=UPI00070855BA|nr:hypothetical protein [Loktanella sp. 3ANDIMAR09]KQI68256.1 hypothetical protein AN189_10535 [Loktanella sp. 3ANDIMAR09]
MLTRRLVLLGGAAALASCSAPQTSSPPDLIAQRQFAGPGPRVLTLYTMRSISNDSGAHTALLIDAPSQRIMFDPAGSFRHSFVAERNDVLFGMTPEVEAYYVSYHARETFYVIAQTIPVSDAVAERAATLALTNGPVPQAFCARATSGILRALPGFEGLPRTFSPNRLSDAFGALPGVATREWRENDPDNKALALAEIEMQMR